jgi:hypothetical protein
MRLLAWRTPAVGWRSFLSGRQGLLWLAEPAPDYCKVTQAGAEFVQHAGVVCGSLPEDGDSLCGGGEGVRVPFEGYQRAGEVVQFGCKILFVCAGLGSNSVSVDPRRSPPRPADRPGLPLGFRPRVAGAADRIDAAPGRLPTRPFPNRLRTPTWRRAARRSAGGHAAGSCGSVPVHWIRSASTRIFWCGPGPVSVSGLAGWRGALRRSG